MAKKHWIHAGPEDVGHHCDDCEHCNDSFFTIKNVIDYVNVIKAQPSIVKKVVLVSVAPPLFCAIGFINLIVPIVDWVDGKAT